MPRGLSWLLAALVLVVAGCASVPPGPKPSVPIAEDAPFAIDGRLSARRGHDGISIAFAWIHSPPRDEFVVSTPLGQAIAELTGDASIPRVEVRTAEGRRDEASDWATLTERVIGFPLPVGGMAAWAQGAPRADAPYAAEIDAAGRAGVLRQDGCEIVYAYADGSTRRPSGLRVMCHDLELRIVIDRWRVS